ncbi:MAG: cadherin-like beta sandwich domain-containing protein [Bacilli bacterium]|nr:cadherin-like beta sandwich domain-containing protein [Bacilli bacterium]
MRKYISTIFILFILLFSCKVYASPANDIFLDDNLYNCIIDAYNQGKEDKKDYSYDILPEELNEITSLDCSKYKGSIEDLTGLNKLISLKSLNLSGNTFLGGTLKLSNNYGKLVSKLNLPQSLAITDKTYIIENPKIAKVENDLVYPLESGSTYITMKAKVSGNEITEKYLVSVDGGTVKKSSNCKLSSLFLTAVNLKKGEGEFSFDNKVKSYYAVVNNSVSKVRVNASVLDKSAKFVEGYGPRDVQLKNGTNTIDVKIKAQDGTICSYFVSVMRSDGTDANNKLANIELSVGKIDFSRDVYNYNFTVATNVDAIDVKGVAESPLSKVTVTDIDSKTSNNSITSKLKIGENKVIITVSSESGSKQEYTLNITREDYDSEDNYLSDIEISNYDINFKRDVYKYDLKIKDEKALIIIAKVEKKNATYSITGNNNLTNNSKIIIKVSDENGSIREYTIIVHKDEKKSVFNISDIFDFSNISIKWIILIAEGVTILVLLLYIIFRGGNKPKKPKVRQHKTNKKSKGNDSKLLKYGNTCKICGAMNDANSKTCYICGNELK